MFGSEATRKPDQCRARGEGSQRWQSADEALPWLDFFDAENKASCIVIAATSRSYEDGVHLQRAASRGLNEARKDSPQLKA